MEEKKHSDNNKPNNVFKSRIRVLENENKDLKDELIMQSGNNDMNTIEYYLRLRTDLLTEIDTLSETAKSNDIKYKTENDFLKKEVSSLKSELTMLMNTKNKLEAHSFNMGTHRHSDRDNIPTNMNTLSLRECEEMQMGASNKGNSNQVLCIENVSSSQLRASPMKKEFAPSNNISTEIEYLGNSNTKERVTELEDKVMELETQLSEKDFVIKDQCDKIAELNGMLCSNGEYAKNEIAMWKMKYNNTISCSKTISDQYQLLFDERVQDYRNNMENSKYELEKKIMHLETVIDHRERDLNVQLEMNRDNLLAKQTNITELKNMLHSLQDNYSLMYSRYNEHLLKLVNNLNNMKNLYFTRELEFINITKYYIDMINEHTSPLHDANATKNKMETQFISQSKDIIKLQHQIEVNVREIMQLLNENNDAQPKMRMRLTKTIQEYDNRLSGIVLKHSELKHVLEVLFDFTKKMEEKLQMFSRVLEHNKLLVDKINLLECQCKMNDPQNKNNQILLLQEKLHKLEKETQVKVALIKDYDELLKNSDTKTFNVKTLSNDDVIIKLKAEITKLNSHINNLTKCKENIETFYQVELRKLIDKAMGIHASNEELLNKIRVMENDFQGSKQTVLNVWMNEFKEFKDNLLSIENIQNVISQFDINGDELTKHKEYICNEELYQLRQEIKGKDDAFEELKLTHDKENRMNMRIIEQYKKSIDAKMQMYEDVIQNRNKEMNAVLHEKKRLVEFDVRKGKLSESEGKCWKEQKDEINAIIMEQGVLKEEQVQKMQKEVKEMECEVMYAKEDKNAQLDGIVLQVNEQMKLIKDREEFTVNQLDLLQELFDTYKDEKEKVIKVLKMENEQLKNFNNLLHKRNNSQN